MVSSAAARSLLLGISVLLMIKTGFLVYFCSWADSLKDRCFGFFFLSPLIRELELVFKRGAPFPGRESIWHLMESWLCVSLGGSLPL